MTYPVIKNVKLGAQFKMRYCMNEQCKKKFLSTHSGHRHCEKCRHLESSPGDNLHKVYA
jgi:hypothetical protein